MELYHQFYSGNTSALSPHKILFINGYVYMTAYDEQGSEMLVKMDGK